MKDKKYFCYEIFKNIAVWSTNGRVGYNPCSLYDGYFETSDQINLTQAWNSDGRKKIIDLVDQDKPIAGCQRCYADEEKGLVSRRLHTKESYETWHKDINIDLTGPQGLDYSVGNLCNLKCIICGPHNSTFWIPDYQKLFPNKNIKVFKYQKSEQIEITSDDTLNNVLSLHFHGGGEPLLSDAHVNLLKKIKSIKGLADVRVFYNTNGTTTVNDEILALWEECKLIELYFSIDDINSRFEYQRPGKTFVSIEQNLQWFYKNMPHNHMFNVNAVWSYLNFYYLDQLTDWCQENLKTNRYGDTVNLIFQTAIGITQLVHVSEPIYNMLLDKFQGHPELIKLVKSLTISDRDHRSFLNWIEKIDQIRNQKFVQVAPEWAKLLS
jgi:hypothetical protein